MVWCNICGIPNDIHENDRYFYLYDEEEEDSIICQYCASQKFTFHKTMNSDKEMLSDDVMYTIQYINPNCGLSQEYMIIMYYDKKHKIIDKKIYNITK